MAIVFGARVVGPLEPYASGFADELTRLGYTVFAARSQFGLVAHLSRWLAEQALAVESLTLPVVEEFLVVRRTAGYAQFRSPKALAALLAYLQRIGASPPPTRVVAAGLVDVLLERYRTYLLVERALDVRSARGYIDLVRPFIVSCVLGDGVDREHVTAGVISSFMVAESRRVASKTVQRLATALRSLLRFWHLDGVLDVPLDHVVPKVRARQSGLPRALPPVQVAALLRSCEQAGRAGVRDYAILTLLSRLGLRSGEVAGLRLDDLDWRRGEITVRGKGNRRDLLPLPVDVGDAVVAYLQTGRPATALDRSLFIRVKAPHRGLTSGGVTQVVAAAGSRAGLGTIFAHRLRHSAATSMLAAGAPLAEIGQVLRHRRPLTTAIYAKVDTEALRLLARPWPGAS